MNKAKYIVKLAQGEMTLDGYDFIVSLIKHLLIKYRWPKIILDDNTNNDNYWSDDEVISFTHQILFYIIDKKKLKNYYKIPISYIEYYFRTIIVSYVANKIKEQQNKFGLSFDDTKRVSLEILNDLYFSRKVKNDVLWNKENIFTNPVKDIDSIKDIIACLPKIPITSKTKHYKPRVKTALNDVFNIINRPITQSVIINQVFGLFDQSSFAVNYDEQITSDIREDVVIHAINIIISKIHVIDIPIYIDYYFGEKKISLKIIAEKYDLPKSTAHYKINKFRKIIFDNFTPNNEQEGVWFLENLHKILDELK